MANLDTQLALFEAEVAKSSSNGQQVRPQIGNPPPYSLPPQFRPPQASQQRPQFSQPQPQIFPQRPQQQQQFQQSHGQQPQPQSLQPPTIRPQFPPPHQQRPPSLQAQQLQQQVQQRLQEQQQILQQQQQYQQQQQQQVRPVSAQEKLGKAEPQSQDFYVQQFAQLRNQQQQQAQQQQLQQQQPQQEPSQQQLQQQLQQQIQQSQQQQQQQLQQLQQQQAQPQQRVPLIGQFNPQNYAQPPQVLIQNLTKNTFTTSTAAATNNLSSVVTQQTLQQQQQNQQQQQQQNKSTTNTKDGKKAQQQQGQGQQGQQGQDKEGAPAVKEKKKKGLPRMGGGQKWFDPTLDEWPEGDFRVFVGDLGNEVNDDGLTRAFNKYKTFQKARVVKDKRTGKTKGYGFISFSDVDDFALAIKEMNGKYIGNRPCKLLKSKWADRNDEQRIQKFSKRQKRNK